MPGQLGKQQHTFVRLVALKLHFKLNQAFKSFKVILAGVGRNPERCVVVMYNKVETYEDYSNEKLQISRFQWSNSGLTTLLRETPSNLYQRFILPETRVSDLHFHPPKYESFTQLRLSLSIEPSRFKTAGTKTDFYMIWPLKVIQGHSHFCNQLQDYKDCLSPCNNVGLNFKVSEEVAKKIVENYRRRQLHCCSVWRPRPEEPRRISAYRPTLYFQKLE